MQAKDIKVKSIAEAHKRAKNSKKVSDKSIFGRIFEVECRKITDNKGFNVIHIKEYI